MGIIVFGIVAWNEVRTAAVEAAQTRLEVVTRRIADLLSSRVATTKAQLAGMSRDPNIRRLALGGDGEARDSAIARVRRLDSLQNTVLAVQIWDATGAVQFSSSPRNTGTDDSRRALLTSLQPDDSAAVSPFVLSSDTLMYATFGPVRTGAPITAWLVVWRRLAER